MKSLFVSAIAILITSFTTAQEVTLTPELLYLESDGNQNHKLYYQVHNNTDTTLTWYWTLFFPDDWPEQWNVSVLDNLLSWPYGLDTMSTQFGGNDLLPQSSTIEFLNFLEIDTRDEAGEGTVIFCIHQDTLYQNPVACTSFVSRVNETDRMTGISLFPNPTQDKIFIELPNGKDCDLMIFDSQGVVVFQQEIRNQRQVEIDTELLTRGIYMVYLYDGEKFHTNLFFRY